MIKRTTMRRALLKVLNVAERILVKNIALKFNASDVTTYLIVAFTAGLIMMYSGKWLQPLLPLGAVVMGVIPVVLFLAHGVEWCIKKMHANRPFGGTEISATQYWSICDILDQREITNARKYFREHIDHAKVLLELITDLHSQRLRDREAIIALVYLYEEKPHTTGVAIYNLVRDRGDMPVSEYRALLEIKDDTSPTLMSGAL